MRGLGTAVNVATVLVGTAVGILAGHRLPERIRTTLLQGAALVVIVLGVDDAAKSRNIVFPLAALVLGGALGEAVDIEARLERLGERLRRRFDRAEDGSTFVEGFVAASLVFCVGPLTILGSIFDGLGRGSHELVVKAALDGIVAVVFASTLGIGVGFSALTILVVQGGLTLTAGAADRVLTERMITEMTAVGGVMILGIGIRLLDLSPIRVASFLPALVLAPVLVGLFAR
ncbi:MAG TPA: DUF554 domain-containing protein [Acidimicrobiales bacterium]|jgi:uncharacterized membrane protein YqgA involved in biofilm formation|nr:DUF554 domain-containing protein [Acidimicrobiales bacterium]